MKTIAPLSKEQTIEELTILAGKLDLTSLPGFDCSNDRFYSGSLEFDSPLDNGTCLYAENVITAFDTSDEGHIVNVEIFGYEYCQQYDLDSNDIIAEYYDARIH